MLCGADLSLSPYFQWLHIRTFIMCSLSGLLANPASIICTVRFGKEVRTSLGNRIARTLFAVARGQMVLLHAFIKKAQQTPNEKIDLAEKRFKEWRHCET